MQMYATSTYRFPIKLASVTSTDSRVVAILADATLSPGQRTRIGSVTFDPSLGGEDYLGSGPWVAPSQGGRGAGTGANDVVRMQALAKVRAPKDAPCCAQKAPATRIFMKISSSA